MTSTRLLARNTALNLVGQVAPLFMAFVAVPVLINALGASAFGVVTLAWLLIGYFSLFDFGLGRALTQSASEALAREDNDGLHAVSQATLIAMFGFGCVGAALLAAVTPWLAYDWLNMDDALRPAAARAFYLLSLSLPFVLSTAGFRGLFEAHQHFGLATALRLPYALFNFVGPLVMLPFTRDIGDLVAVLVAGRIVTWAAHLFFGLHSYPWLRRVNLSGFRRVGPLMRVGGWMTVSNIIGPLMSHLDRFLIAAVLSTAAVAYYVTPFELVTKLLFVPMAVSGVFFPAFAATYRTNASRTADHFDRASRFLLLAMFPVILVIVALAREGLLLWVGPDFSREGARVLQILAMGVLINSIAQVPFGFLQASARADLTAKLHVAELPVYALLIVVFARSFGLVGFAVAWSVRNAIDAILLSVLTARQLPESKPALRRTAAWLALMTGLFAGLCFTNGVVVRIGMASIAIVAFIPAAWTFLMSARERAMVRDALPWRTDEAKAV